VLIINKLAGIRNYGIGSISFSFSLNFLSTGVNENEMKLIFFFIADYIIFRASFNYYFPILSDQQFKELKH
jgi:hypothetical protein